MKNATLSELESMTADELTAKGYVTGDMAAEEIYSLNCNNVYK
jgi:hypothetical protein